MFFLDEALWWILGESFSNIIVTGEVNKINRRVKLKMKKFLAMLSVVGLATTQSFAIFGHHRHKNPVFDAEKIQSQSLRTCKEDAFKVHSKKLQELYDKCGKVGKTIPEKEMERINKEYYESCFVCDDLFNNSVEVL